LRFRHQRGMRVTQQQGTVAAHEIEHLDFAALLVAKIKLAARPPFVVEVEAERAQQLAQAGFEMTWFATGLGGPGERRTLRTGIHAKGRVSQRAAA
jgi:hypothetical protein